MKANHKPKFIQDERGLMFNMLITAGMSVIVLIALLNIGTYINGQIGDSLIETYPSTLTDRSTLQNRSVSSLNNISADYDSIIDIVTVTAIIMVIILPLAAIIAVKKLF